MSTRTLAASNGSSGRSLVALATYALALLAWASLFGRWLPMPDAMPGVSMSDPGVPEAMATNAGPTGVGLYLLAWGVMMVAMMYPGAARLFSVYADGDWTRTRRAKLLAVSVFVGTYTLVWTLTGLVPLAANLVVPIASTASAAGPVFFGSAVVALAAFQLTPHRFRCLRHCRSPEGFVEHHREPGVRGAVRTAWHVTRYDVGSCWPLMSLMVVVGSMNVFWMVVIALVLFLERTVPRGELLARTVGVAGGVVGVGIVASVVV